MGFTAQELAILNGSVTIVVALIAAVVVVAAAVVVVLIYIATLIVEEYSVTIINPLRTVVPYMHHRKMEFNTCEQIAITSSSLA